MGYCGHAAGRTVEDIARDEEERAGQGAEAGPRPYAFDKGIHYRSSLVNRRGAPSYGDERPGGRALER